MHRTCLAPHAQPLANASQLSTVNGLNRITTVNGAAATYDGRGNLTTDPATGKAYAYWVTDNQLRTVASPYLALGYDALSRLRSGSHGSTVTSYVSDGTAIVAEYDTAGALQKRYVFGPSIDEPIVAYDAAGARSWMLADERGSVVALASDSGAMSAINSYDDYGVPGASNIGPFQYAGQLWLARPGVHYSVYRQYAQHLGRFLQPDPIGYEGGMNLYAYVGNDPVNWVDPLGLTQAQCSAEWPDTTWVGTDRFGIYCQAPLVASVSQDIIVIGRRIRDWILGGGRGDDARPTQPQRTQTPTPCQRTFLKDQLGSRGLPTSQIDNLKFVSGLDSNANALTRSAFNGGAGAVTQGSTVYVQPGGFDTVANFRSATGFEEAYHTAQFASNRGFYSSYGLLSLGGLLSMGDSYNGNMYEAFAKGAARQMFEASKGGMCPR